MEAKLPLPSSRLHRILFPVDSPTAVLAPAAFSHNVDCRNGVRLRGFLPLTGLHGIGTAELGDLAVQVTVQVVFVLEIGVGEGAPEVRIECHYKSRGWRR